MRMITTKLIVNPGIMAGIAEFIGHKPAHTPPAIMPATAAHLLFIFVCNEMSRRGPKLQPRPVQA